MVKTIRFFMLNLKISGGRLGELLVANVAAEGKTAEDKQGLDELPELAALFLFSLFSGHFIFLHILS